MVNGYTGFVVAHPAHLLTAMGMILRWKPKILLLTQTRTGAGSGQATLIRNAFELIGFDGCITDLAMDEVESYRRVLLGEFDFCLQQLPKICDWLQQHKIETVFGDAYESSNFQHDVGRLMLDHAIAMLGASHQTIANYEIPLFARANRNDSELIYGQFLSGEHQQIRLTPSELKAKRRVIEFAMKCDPFVKGVVPKFQRLDIESYRRVPSDRDYRVPPAGLALYYDALGMEHVAAGRYQDAILFEKHFRPLVQRLEQISSHRLSA